MIAGEAHRYPILPLFLVALFLLLAAPIYWRTLEQPEAKRKERAYENAQLYQRVYPMAHYGYDRLRSGDLPLWTSRQLCGTPFLANPQTGLFQPLNAVFLLPDTGYALAAHAFLSLFFMAFGFVLFARSLGTGFTSALIGGLTYAFSGASAAAISRPELAGALAWAPFFFWAVREFAHDWRLTRALAAALAGALVLLAGSFAMATVMLLLGIAYALMFMVVARPFPAVPVRRRAGGLLLLIASMLALSLVQWLPSLEWLASLAAPGRVLWQADIAGIAPRSLRELAVQLVTAPQGQLPALGYLGIVSLAILPAAYFNRSSQLDAWFFTAAAIALPCIAFSGGLPGETVFNPALLLYPAVFSVATLTALGADRLLTTSRDPRSPLIWVPAVLSIASACFLFWIAPAPVKGILMVLALVLLPFLVIRSRWLALVSGAAVVTVVFIDLSMAARNEYLHPFEDSPASYQVHEKVLLAGEEQALGGRLLLSAQPLDVGMSPNLGFIYPMHFAGGAYLPLTREQAAWWERLSGTTEASPAATRLSPGVVSPALLNYMAVRVLLKGPGSALGAGLWPAEGARFRLTREVDGVQIYVNDTALPRVYWTPNWKAAAGLDEAVETMTAAGFDGASTCVVTAEGAGLDQLIATVPDQTVPYDGVDWEKVATRIDVDTPERVVIQSEAARPGLVVLADTFASGWKATVDGVPAPILRANGLFRAVAVPEGAHVIEMRYQPWSWYAGAAISIAVLLAILIALCVGFLRRPSAHDHTFA